MQQTAASAYTLSEVSEVGRNCCDKRSSQQAYTLNPVLNHLPGECDPTVILTNAVTVFLPSLLHFRLYLGLSWVCIFKVKSLGGRTLKH